LCSLDGEDWLEGGAGMSCVVMEFSMLIVDADPGLALGTPVSSNTFAARTDLEALFRPEREDAGRSSEGGSSTSHFVIKSGLHLFILDADLG